jgi:hypothetical protein
VSLPPRDDELGHGDIEAALATRRELGARYDTELVDGFAERIERAVDRRVGDELRVRRQAGAARASAGPRQLALGIVSVVAGIPITAITLAIPEEAELSLFSLLVAWGGIGAVNVAHAWQSRRS